MIFESEKRVYDNKNSRYISSEWILDTDTQTVIHTNENLETSERVFYTDQIRYHLHYSEEYAPERLQKLVNEGKIIEYLEELELKVTDAVNKQAEMLMNSSKEYKIALEKGDLNEVGRIGNMLQMIARNSIFDTMVYM